MNNKSEKQEKTRDERGRLLPGHTANPNGRPKKGQTLTDLMGEYLNGINEQSGLQRKEEFVRKVAIMAYQGDISAIKLIWNYLDGMPEQNMNLGQNPEKPLLIFDLNYGQQQKIERINKSSTKTKHSINDIIKP